MLKNMRQNQSEEKCFQPIGHWKKLHLKESQGGARGAQGARMNFCLQC